MKWMKKIARVASRMWSWLFDWRKADRRCRPCGFIGRPYTFRGWGEDRCPICGRRNVMSAAARIPAEGFHELGRDPNSPGVTTEFWDRDEAVIDAHERLKET